MLLCSPVLMLAGLAASCVVQRQRFQQMFPNSCAPCSSVTLYPLCSSHLLQGFDNVNNILSSNGAYAPGLLIQIVVMKVIATSICRGSGLQVCPPVLPSSARCPLSAQIALASFGHACFKRLGLSCTPAFAWIAACN